MKQGRSGVGWFWFILSVGLNILLAWIIWGRPAPKPEPPKIEKENKLERITNYIFLPSEKGEKTPSTPSGASSNTPVVIEWRFVEELNGYRTGSFFLSNISTEMIRVGLEARWVDVKLPVRIIKRDNLIVISYGVMGTISAGYYREVLGMDPASLYAGAILQWNPGAGRGDISGGVLIGF